MNRPATDESSLLRLLADSIPLAIFLTDPAGRISGWTGSAEKMLGYSGSEVIGRQFDTLFEPSTRAADQEIRAVELAGRAANYKEVGRATRADGSRFLAIFTMDRLSDRGATIGYACTIGPV